LHLKAPEKKYCRLPYIIGSKEYEEDDYIGLREPKSAAVVEPPPMPVEEVKGQLCYIIKK